MDSVAPRQCGAVSKGAKAPRKKLRASPRCTSDNGQYGAHSLALLNAIQTGCVIAKGTVAKKGGIQLAF